MAMTKAEVREAFREVMAADYADVPKREEIEHTFSPEFYARMDALIAEQKRGSWRMMPRQCKRVLVVAAILAATLMLVACSPVLRHAVARLAVTIYETFIDFTVDTTEGELKTEIETVYGLNPLPEGFEMVSQKWVNPYYLKTIYEDKGEAQIVLIQTAPKTAIATNDVEKTNSVPEIIEDIEMWLLSADELQTASMIYDGYNFTIHYVGFITQSDFKRIATSIVSVS